jgi:hypothetical protein
MISRAIPRRKPAARAAAGDVASIEERDWRGGPSSGRLVEIVALSDCTYDFLFLGRDSTAGSRHC